MKLVVPISDLYDPKHCGSGVCLRRGEATLALLRVWSRWCIVGNRRWILGCGLAFCDMLAERGTMRLPSDRDDLL